MPSQLTYPGVYVEEITSPVHPITGVATSITAFVGTAPRGPVGKATECLSFGDYARSFGGLDTTSEMSYAVSQFFLNGGGKAEIVRVAGNPLPAKLALNGAGGKPVLVATSLMNGKSANHISITVAQRTAADGLFDLVVQYRDPSDPSDTVTEKFFGLSMDNTDANYVDSVMNDPDTGSKLIKTENQIPKVPALGASVTKAGVASSAALAMSVPGSPPQLLDPAQLLLPDQDSLSIIVNQIPVQIDGLIGLANWPANAAAADKLSALCKAIQKAVKDAAPAGPAGVALGAFACTSDLVKGTITMTSGAPGYTSDVVVSGPAAAALMLSAAYGGTSVSGASQLNPAPLPGFAAQPLAGGDETPLNAADKPTEFSLAYIGDSALRTGMYALEGVDLFNILCLPGISDQSIPSAPGILSAAAAYCLARRAFLIIDSPKPLGTDGFGPNLMRDAVTSSPLLPKSDHAAVYYPWLKMPDPLQGGRSRLVAPCGTVAGIFARTDANRGVWKAPAGIEASLSGVVGLDYRMTDSENGTLNPLGVNCIRNFPVYGPIVWGARTLRGADAFASDYKYVPVRRFALFLEESLFRGLKWVVFEPNDEPLWGAIRLNVGAFMHDLFVQGAFEGSSARDAYRVQCDSSTTSQNDIDKGIVNIIVAFAPLKPAEFVVLQIQQLAGQIQT